MNEIPLKFNSSVFVCSAAAMHLYIISMHISVKKNAPLRWSESSCCPMTPKPDAALCPTWFGTWPHHFHRLHDSAWSDHVPPWTTTATVLPPLSIINCLQEIKIWMTTNLLKLNSKETELMVMGPKVYL